MLKQCKVHGPIEGRVCMDGRKYQYLACPKCLDYNSRVYRQKHKLRYLLSKAKYRTKWAIDIDEAYLKEIYTFQQGLCALTKEPMLDDISIDRIDSTKGYIKGNIQLLITIINRMKRELPLDKFIHYCKDVARNN